MPTAETHITRALYLLGVSSPIKPASPEIKAACLISFNDMVERWGKNATEIGLTTAAALGNEVYNVPWSNPVVQYSLAVEFAPICQVATPPDVKTRQIELMREMEEHTRLAVLSPERVSLDPRTPLGSGVTRGLDDMPRFAGDADE